MIIYSEDKYGQIQSSVHSHRESFKSLRVGVDNLKKITKHNRKKLSNTNSKFLKSLGLTLKTKQ